MNNFSILITNYKLNPAFVLCLQKIRKLYPNIKVRVANDFTGGIHFDKITDINPQMNN
ncbi:MAG: hypothetical protein ACOCP8_00320 [archaeon]